MQDVKRTIIFRPLEARFNEDNNWVIKMNPYCKFKLGWHSAKSAIAHHGGKNPVWSDSISLPRKHGEKFAKLKLKDRDRLSMDDRLGEVKIDLDEVVAKGNVNKWYNIYKKDKLVGEINLDIVAADNITS